MDDLERHYGKHPFVLYALFASVPGKKAWPRMIFLAFSVPILLWTAVGQVLKIVNERFKRQCVIQLFPTTIAVLGCLMYIPYVAFATEKQLKTLLSIMISDLKDERTEAENEVKRQYYRNARIFVNVYTILFAFAIFSIFLTGFIPDFLDLLIPLNVTREKKLLVPGEYFLDQQEYYYLLHFLECCTAFVVIVLIISTENMAVIIGLHACSMTAMVGYRLENLTHFDDECVLNKSSYKCLVTKRMHRCIQGHQISLHFTSLIAAFYDIPLTIIVSATFCALTVSLVQATTLELMNTVSVILTIGQVFQLYVLSYMGQCSVDYAEKLATNAYNAKWYVCSPRQRKLLQLVILRSAKPYMVTARNMYTLTVQNFMQVMQTVTSFYMALRQTQ